MEFTGINHKIQRLYLHWDLLTKCNLDCSYCYAKEWYSKKNEWQREANYKTQLYIIECIKLAKLPVFLGLLGGEPTLDTNFNPLVEKIKNELLPLNADNRLYITSNMYNPLELPQDYKIRVLCSYHPEFKYKKRFIENVKKLKHKTRINLMLIPDYKNDILEVYHALKEYDIHPHFVYKNHRETLIYKDFEVFKELQKVHKEFLYNNILYSDYEIFELNLNKFYGWDCWNNNYEISYNALVKNLCSNKSISLYENPLFFKRIETIEPMICPWEYCNCDGLLKCKKLNTAI